MSALASESAALAEGPQGDRFETWGIPLTAAQHDLISRAESLAQDNFASRAAEYDQAARFPAEDFDDLFRSGLLAAAVPRSYGGLGLGPFADDVFSLWMMTKVFAKADLSLARCWEGHANSMVLLANIADPAQRERWFGEVVDKGVRWVAWSGEPQARAPGQKRRFGTELEQVEGGYRVAGTKVFASSADGADRALILVNRYGPGGARHVTGATDGVLMLACDLSDPSISRDDSWWDPIGMRGTVSHLVRFDRTFIPDSDVIGRPGQYLEEGWQTCFTPQYAASFLGAAESAHDFALEYLSCQGKGDDPYIQHHVGSNATSLQTAHLWLRHVAQLWETGRNEAARAAGVQARYLIDQLATDVVHRCIQACGARSLIKPNRLERIYRDLSFYVLHDNADRLLATIGKSVLGEAHDQSFFNK